MKARAPNDATTHRSVPRLRLQRSGFTLLELLIALAVFAVASAMAYGGLQAVLNTQRDVETRAERLSQIQRAFSIFERDLQQAVSRSVRDEFGDVRPAFLGDNTEDGHLAFTRGARQNPGGFKRSQLQRVEYGLKDRTLVRLTWRSLDRVPGEEPYGAELLGKVWRFGTRFYAGDNQWHEQWPPIGTAPEAGGLPLAVEVTVELEDWGAIRRIYTLPVQG